MTRPWTTLDAAETAEGRLELRQRGDGDFLITIGGRVLMNSRQARSEVALGELAARAAAAAVRPRVLIGGLGMGCTLRAALDALPGEATIIVSELHEVIVRWCDGPLAALTSHATADARVRIEPGDVAARIGRAAASGERFHAIALDLYEGPHAGRGAARDPLFGDAALAATRRALASGGTFAVWSENRDPGFEKRLRRAGFTARVHRPGRGGLRHAVYLARRTR